MLWLFHCDLISGVFVSSSNIRPENATSNHHDFYMHTFEKITSCNSCHMLLRWEANYSHASAHRRARVLSLSLFFFKGPPSPPVPLHCAYSSFFFCSAKFLLNSLNAAGAQRSCVSWSLSRRERLSGFVSHGWHRKMSVTLKHVFKATAGEKGTRLLLCEYTEPPLNSPTFSQGDTPACHSEASKAERLTTLSRMLLLCKLCLSNCWLVPLSLWLLFCSSRSAALIVNPIDLRWSAAHIKVS